MQKIKQDIQIGDTLRTYRLMANYTQEQVVAKLQLMGMDVSRSCYSQMECGTYNIRISELIALTEIFSVDFNSIFNKAAEKFKKQISIK